MSTDTQLAACWMHPCLSVMTIGALRHGIAKPVQCTFVEDVRQGSCTAKVEDEALPGLGWLQAAVPSARHTKNDWCQHRPSQRPYAVYIPSVVVQYIPVLGL